MTPTNGAVPAYTFHAIAFSQKKSKISLLLAPGSLFHYWGTVTENRFVLVQYLVLETNYLYTYYTGWYAAELKGNTINAL